MSKKKGITHDHYYGEGKVKGWAGALEKDMGSPCLRRELEEVEEEYR